MSTLRIVLPCATAPADEIEAVVEDLGNLAYRVAYRILGEREEARDVAQEAIIEACASWPRVRSYAEAWTARVATNLSLKVIRRRKRSGEDQLSVSGPANPDVSLRVDLQRALLELSPREREAVALHYLADLPYEDVGELLGCAPGTVKRYVHRGITRLREQLGPSAEELRWTS